MCCGPVLQCLNAFPSRGPHWLIALKDNDFPTTLIPLGLFPLVRMCVVCAGLLPAWVQLESTAYWRHAVGTNPTSWLCILQHVAAHSNQKLWCLCAWQQARKIIKIHFSKAFFISQWKTWGVFFSLQCIEQLIIGQPIQLCAGYELASSFVSGCACGWLLCSRSHAHTIV